MQKRMTRISRENIKVADSIIIDCFHHGDGFCPALWQVICFRNGRQSYVHASDSILFYSSAKVARQAIRRIRKDIEPTTQEF